MVLSCGIESIVKFAQHQGAHSRFGNPYTRLEKSEQIFVAINCYHRGSNLSQYLKFCHRKHAKLIIFLLLFFKLLFLSPYSPFRQTNYPNYVMLANNCQKLAIVAFPSQCVQLRKLRTNFVMKTTLQLNRKIVISV